MIPINNLLNNLKNNINNTFTRLYRILYNKELYQKAFNSLKNNRKEVDINKSIFKYFNDDLIEELIKELRNQSYQPLSIKEYGNNSKTLTDYLLEEALVILLETIFEPVLSENLYGVRGRNQHSALLNIKDNFSNSVWFIEGDITGSFSKINKEILISLLKERIKDDRFINLIRKFIKKGYLESWDNSTYSKTSAGETLSIILANIYFDQLDSFIENYILKKSAIAVQDSTLGKGLHYVRYHDYFFIGIMGNKAEALKLRKDIIQFLKQNLDIDINLEKLKLTHSRKRTYFLGYEILKIKENKEISLRFSQETLTEIVLDKRLVKDISKRPWEPISKAQLTFLEDHEIINIYNAELSNIYHYFSLADNINTMMNSLHHIMEYSCLRTLARKHKTSLTKYRKKHKLEKNKWGVKIHGNDGEKKVYLYKGFYQSINNKFSDQKLIQDIF